MGPGKRSRFLAPVALVGAIVATILVITSAVHSSHTSGPPRTVSTAGRRASTATRTSGSAQTTTLPSSSASATYTVRAGDNLSTIAARTGVPLATLERLNPAVNPATLQTGQRLRLR
jgi:LysM repeat protein